MTSTESARWLRHCRERLRGKSARLARLREDHGGRARKQQAGDFVDRFVPHRAIDEMDSAPGELLVPKRHKLPRARRIVRAVEIDRRRILQPFEASRPANRREPAGDRGVIDGEAALGEQPRRRDGSQRVAHLKAPGQRQANLDLARRALPGRLRRGHESIAAVFGAKVRGAA